MGRSLVLAEIELRRRDGGVTLFDCHLFVNAALHRLDNGESDWECPLRTLKRLLDQTDDVKNVEKYVKP